MTVLYFGIYDPLYPRNRILIEGLRQNNVKVIECNSRALGFKKYIELYKKHKKIKNSYDVMVVGFMGQLIVPYAKLLCRKKIVFDAFLSIYNSHVYDRKDVKRNSLKARYYYLLDWLSVRLADTILLDTQAHIDYFVKVFHAKKNKLHRIWIGAYDGIFKPYKNYEQKTHKLVVLWWGWYIPLHGIEYILEAAEILRGEPIDFYFYGGGKGRKKAEKTKKERNLSNVIFKEALKPDELVKEIQNCDIALGIFGNTDKTLMVIPNKVYEALACRKTVVTGDTNAAKEILQDRKHCVLCKVASGKDLAEKILYLKNNKETRNTIAKNGYELYTEMFTPKVLGKELKNIIVNYYETTLHRKY